MLVAKWLCQKSAIFSWSGRWLCTMRNSSRWRASFTTVLGENCPRVVTDTNSGRPMLSSTVFGACS